MGTSRSGAELAAKLTKAARGIETANKAGVQRAAQDVQRTTLGLMRSATGGDLMLSGTTRKAGGAGKRIGVKVKIEQASGQPRAYIAATGPAQLIENDVAKHPVVSRYATSSEALQYKGKKRVVNSRKSRQARGLAVRLGTGTEGDRRAVLHWGNNFRRWTVASSKGRHPWKRGLASAEPKVRANIKAGAAKALVESMR